MINMTLREAAGHLGLEADGNEGFKGIATDSRMIKSGMMFAALKGERVDGHDFVEQAVNAGASVLLVEKPVEVDLPQLVVDDVLVALGQLAAAWCRTVNPKVIAITGSNGKTTTKEMVASILERNSKVLATQGNHNNELGLPLTLFGLEQGHHYAVLELGASKAGDIRYLAGIAKPEVGIVTNAGPAHLQGFGDEEGVARAKGELFSSLPVEGFAIINSDDRWCDLWQEMASPRSVLTFGTGEDCDVRLVDEAGGLQIITPAGSFELSLQMPGEHNRWNALAATAACLSLDVPLDVISEGLAQTTPVPGRVNLIQTDAGWTVIDDTYNANPASLYAALQMLVSDHDEPWLVLGDMKELGGGARKLHAEMGEAAAALGVRRLYALGDMSAATAQAFGSGARHFDSSEELTEALRQDLKPGVACLVKGSRSMAMEHVVQAISAADQLREAG